MTARSAAQLWSQTRLPPVSPASSTRSLASLRPPPMRTGRRFPASDGAPYQPGSSMHLLGGGPPPEPPAHVPKRACSAFVDEMVNANNQY